MQRTKTAGQQAFEASGLSLDLVARRIDVSPDYLKTLLRTGARSHCTAERLRLVLGCRVEVFLPVQRKTHQPTNLTTK